MNAQNIGQILDALAARFSVPAAHLWDILIRQAYVNFVIALVAFLITAPAFGYATRRWLKADGYEEGERWGGVTLLTGVLFTGAVLAVLSTVGGAVNPEYYALNAVLTALGGAK